MRYEYIILGLGAAAISAAKAIRQRSGEGRILIIGKEDRVCYSRPMLTKVPLTHYDVSNSYIEPENWYKENNIDLCLSTTITGIDPRAKTVATDKGLFGYGKCIYALGADNLTPPFKGMERRNIFSLRTDRDLMNIRRGSLKAKHAAIIGGGVIGLEAAYMLKSQGLEVSVIETEKHLLPRVLDEKSSAYLQSRLEGISIITGARVLGFDGDELPREVLIQGREPVKAELVLISCGVRANTEIARNAGIKTDRAVVVDDHMETSIKDIYACGDCAQFNGRNTALWTQATEEGHIAGLNAAGGNEAYRGSDSSILLSTPYFSLYCEGDLGKDPNIRYEERLFCGRLPERIAINERPKDLYERDFLVDGKLVGVFMLGNLRDMEDRRRTLAR